MSLKNAQYNTIIRQYDQKQLENNYVREKRLQEVYQAIPAFKDLDLEISKISASYARKTILGGQTDNNGLHQELARIEQQKSSLLVANGYPSDYLEAIYHCKDCKDLGYIGKEKCHCFKQAIVDLLYAQSNIKERLIAENFDHFNLNFYSDNVDKRLGISPKQRMTSILNASQDFIKNFDKGGQNILFYGNTGVGKSFLTNCIAKELLDRSYTVIHLTAFSLVDIVEKNTFGNNDDDPCDDQMFHYIFDCDLLIIDDLGTELNNSFVTSQLFLCINQRILSNKSTIISTNLSLDELSDTYSERIFSRLISDYQILHILGDDIRVKKAISS